MVGGLRENPASLEINEELRGRVSDEPFYVHIQMSEQNLNPFHGGSESGGMKVTLVRYELNGLSDVEGDEFLTYYRNHILGHTTGSFYQEFFDLPSTPLEGENGAPKWGEDPSGMPPTLSITPEQYDAWARLAREEREDLREQQAALRRVREEQEALWREEAAAAAPRTRARAAAEAAAREEREQLNDF